MAEVVVLGAGLGGVIAAYEIKEKLRGKDRLTVISKGDSYFFVPSNPWVAVSWRDRASIEVKLPPVMKKKGINFINPLRLSGHDHSRQEPHKDHDHYRLFCNLIDGKNY